MKMAKASEADISMSMTMANILDDIERGYFPAKLASDPESEETEWLDTADREQYGRLIDGMRRVLNQGSIFRVIFGMAVVCDPDNELLDPTSDVLAVHPKLTLALEQRDDALKSAAAVNAQFEEISKQRDELLVAAKAAMQCVGELGPTRPRVEVFVMLQDTIARCGDPGKPAKTECSDGSPA